MHHGRLRKIVITSLLIILSISLALYAYYQSKDFISGPQIEILNPKNGDSFDKALITIEGVAKNIARININDRQIFVDKNGLFSEKLLLLEGYNIITIYAEDKFEKTKKKELHLVLLENTDLRVELPEEQPELDDLLEVKDEKNNGNKKEKN